MIIARAIASPPVQAVIAAAGVWLACRGPVVTNTNRIVAGICILLFIASLLGTAWPHTGPRRIAIASLGAAILVIFCPWGGTVTREQERAAIVRAARQYDGAPYLWGGEARTGIDCSGLVRRAYMDASLVLALSHASPPHLRRAIRFWIFDTSARDFEGKPPVDGIRIARPASLKESVTAGALPGDAAVVGNGVHVLLYLGDDRWIQADPRLHKVRENASDEPRADWGDVGAALVRPAFLSDR